MIHMETVRLTASQALVRFLENQYISYIDMDGNEQEHKFVKGIFMLPGHGNVVGFANGVEQELKDMVVYQGKNEQGMALAAVGYAKQMRRKSIFACTSSVGPGACNMVTAAATATANNIPVLILPGDIYASRQPDPVLQQMEQPQNLSISAHDAFQAVTKYWGRINRPEQVMTDMISAMRVLTDTANTGAVAISLPQDVQAEAYDYPVDFFKKRVWRIDRRPVTKYALDKAVEVIKNAKKPLLICGGGVRYAEAHKVFKKFAEDFGIAFGETQAGKSAVVWDHELNLGGLGTTGGIAANKLAHEADVVIGVPDSGLSAAMGYAKESGIPYDIGFVKNKYIGRTFIQPSQAMRENSVRIKLNVLKNTVEGKRVVMVDDSIVRGTTSKRIVSLLRHFGATEVHVRSSAPPFMFPCYFGTDVPSKDQLVACNYTMDGIKELIGADSIGFLSVNSLEKIIPNANCQFCDGCFSGKYPVDVD